jgi:hypothetical protein
VICFLFVSVPDLSCYSEISYRIYLKCKLLIPLFKSLFRVTLFHRSLSKGFIKIFSLFSLSGLELAPYRLATLLRLISVCLVSPVFEKRLDLALNPGRDRKQFRKYTISDLSKKYRQVYRKEVFSKWRPQLVPHQVCQNSY